MNGTVGWMASMLVDGTVGWMVRERYWAGCALRAAFAGASVVDLTLLAVSFSRERRWKDGAVASYAVSVARGGGDRESNSSLTLTCASRRLEFS